ncbi:unnamed protein product [Macrosiphum euphorbiae]|uniref:Uncharacterized protein n=1 Tax=Macrosiphum euphorbiae TaxID=13131 RepID=A0AAV0XIX9_9HEMI|nr:unnamed protein product [Macrosiphum euphorbiae]
MSYALEKVIGRPATTSDGSRQRERGNAVRNGAARQLADKRSADRLFFIGPLVVRCRINTLFAVVAVRIPDVWRPSTPSLHRSAEVGGSRAREFSAVLRAQPHQHTGTL